MNRLTDKDWNFGPFTVARWRNRFSAMLESGDDEDPENSVLLVGFGWALRYRLPYWTTFLLKPSGKYGENPREYGVAILSSEGKYDAVSVHFGPQTGDSSTTMDWYKTFPWTKWRHVRTSLYHPDGRHFADEPRDKGRPWREWGGIKKSCPKSHFRFVDFDGTEIVAACTVTEMEWARGDGTFKWLSRFVPNRVRRSLDLWFSAEVGRGKGGWKGGVRGTGTDMEPGETPESAFRRYCEREHRSRDGNYVLTFIGPVEGVAA